MKHGYIGFAIVLTVALTIRLIIYLVNKDKNRMESQICLRDGEKDCLAYAEAGLMFERVCSAIASDDFTYKVMKTNFEDAILQETLKINGNSGNCSKYTKNCLVL